MREPGYYWVTRGYDPFIARWTGNSWLCGWSASIKVLSERIPAPGEPCTCEPGIMRFDYPDEASLSPSTEAEKPLDTDGLCGAK